MPGVPETRANARNHVDPFLVFDRVNDWNEAIASAWV